MKEGMVQHTAAVILAAGKGSRMNLVGKNKVTVEVGGIPIITRTISTLKKTSITPIVVVVGHAKESVMNLLDSDILVTEQHDQRGTGDALKSALPQIPHDIQHVFVLNGDDSFLLSPQIFEELYTTHTEKNAVMTFLTRVTDQSSGIGRIKRINGKVTSIVEEKEATPDEKKITEVNAACYLFDMSFLRENISLLKESSVTGEFYIVQLVEIARNQQLNIETVTVDNLQWKGINTLKELEEANKLFNKMKS